MIIVIMRIGVFCDDEDGEDRLFCCLNLYRLEILRKMKLVRTSEVRPVVAAVALLLGGAACAQDYSHDSEDVLEKSMPTVDVKAQSLDSRLYTREEMDAIPEGNRDLTSLISTHPAVRQNPTVAGSGNRGSLEPESFSIHGESPYQNQFLIDGIGATNVISPQNDNRNLQIGNVPGFSQAYNLDTELLDAVEVYDSRVPVEFGHFTGGVVDARIKTPQGINKIVVKRSFNSSNLTQQKMPPKVSAAWEAGEPGYSAVWKKHFSSINADLRISESTAALFSFSRRESEIQRTGKVLDRSSGIPNGKTTRLVSTDQNDQVDNMFAKFHKDFSGGLEANVTFKYADRQESLVDNFFADTNWINRQKAYGLGFDAIKRADQGKLTLKLGFDQLDALRESSGTEFVTQQFADKSLSQYTYGGYGTEALEQRQMTAKLRMDWNSFATGHVLHKIYAGVDLQSIEAKFDRKNDAYSSRAVQQLDGSQKYFSRNHYMAGTAEAGYNSLGLYASNTMQLGNWGWTVGARIDHDNFFKNTNFAPRSRIDWDAFGNGKTQISMGWSRYYGLDLLGYALTQEKSKLKRTLVDSKGNVVNTPAVAEVHIFDGIKTPRSDEWAFSVTQQLTEYLEGGVSYVRRASRDSVTQDKVDGNYVYVNGGYGNAETAVLSLRSLKTVNLLAARWSGRVDFSWHDAWRNHDTAEAWEGGAESPDDLILYDGKKIQRKDKPASDFSQPRKLSFGFSGNWLNQGVTWGNRINWNSSKSGVAYLGISAKPEQLEKYGVQKIPAYWTWDTSITWKPRQMKGLILNVDILNLLNKIAPIAVANPSAANNVRYKIGREIWLNAGYEF